MLEKILVRLSFGCKIVDVANGACINRGIIVVLVSQEIADRKIVHNAKPAGKRPTTYDATVGCIIQEGVEINGRSFTLAPRGIVWVISAETFSVPDDTTGLATLRTTWTHDGLLALNVGIVDPGWNGQLAAAIVNFSQDSFVIDKGEAFLRVVFHGHHASGSPRITKDGERYKREIINKSLKFSTTFLQMDKLVSEVSDKVFGLPKWAQYIAIYGFLLALLAIFAPLSLSVYSDYYTGPERIEILQGQIDDLKDEKQTSEEVDALKKRITDLEDAMRHASQMRDEPSVVPQWIETSRPREAR